MSSSSANPECRVCIERVTPSKRVVCGHCDFLCCQRCLYTYVLSVPVLTTVCMNCRMPMELSEQPAVTKVFLKGPWYEHSRKVLFNHAETLFPRTMEIIDLERRRDEEYATQRSLERRIRNLRGLIHQSAQRVSDLNHHIIQLSHRNPTQNSKASTSRFNRYCIAENCRGMIDEQQAKCGICSARICLECNVLLPSKQDAMVLDESSTEQEKTEEHVCHPDDVETWKAIQKDTRPCPTCHVRIHRISGCAQMWCPQCHTAFDYRTGSIEKQHIHNPHYYEWIRRNPEAAAQEEQNRNRRCGVHAGHGGVVGVVTLFQLREFLDRRASRSDPSEEEEQRRKMMFSFHRLLMHLREHEFRSLERTIRSSSALEWRKKFLRNEVSRDVFEAKNEKCHRSQEKSRELLQLYQMVYEVGMEFFREMIAHNRIVPDIDIQVTTLLSIANEAIVKWNKKFRSALPPLTCTTVEK